MADRFSRATARKVAVPPPSNLLPKPKPKPVWPDEQTKLQHVPTPLEQPSSSARAGSGLGEMLEEEEELTAEVYPRVLTLAGPGLSYYDCAGPAGALRADGLLRRLHAVQCRHAMSPLRRTRNFLQIAYSDTAITSGAPASAGHDLVSRKQLLSFPTPLTLTQLAELSWPALTTKSWCSRVGRSSITIAQELSLEAFEADEADRGGQGGGQSGALVLCAAEITKVCTDTTTGKSCPLPETRRLTWAARSDVHPKGLSEAHGWPAIGAEQTAGEVPSSLAVTATASMCAGGHVDHAAFLTMALDALDARLAQRKRQLDERAEQAADASAAEAAENALAAAAWRVRQLQMEYLSAAAAGEALLIRFWRQTSPNWFTFTITVADSAASARCIGNIMLAV